MRPGRAPRRRRQPDSPPGRPHRGGSPRAAPARGLNRWWGVGRAGLRPRRAVLQSARPSVPWRRIHLCTAARETPSCSTMSAASQPARCDAHARPGARARRAAVGSVAAATCRLGPAGWDPGAPSTGHCRRIGPARPRRALARDARPERQTTFDGRHITMGSLPGLSTDPGAARHMPRVATAIDLPTAALRPPARQRRPRTGSQTGEVAGVMNADERTGQA